jgi:hypothetical protein
VRKICHGSNPAKANGWQRILSSATIVCANNAKRARFGRLHLVVPDGAHGLGGLEGSDCVVRLMTEFVARGTAKDLDTTCVKNVRRRSFVLKL